MHNRFAEKVEWSDKNWWLHVRQWEPSKEAKYSARSRARLHCTAYTQTLNPGTTFLGREQRKAVERQAGLEPKLVIELEQRLTSVRTIQRVQNGVIVHANPKSIASKIHFTDMNHICIGENGGIHLLSLTRERKAFQLWRIKNLILHVVSHPPSSPKKP